MTIQQLDSFNTKVYRWCELKDLSLANLIWSGVKVAYGENFQAFCNVKLADSTEFNNL